MKKAIVLGGSNGIGLSLSLPLVNRGYQVIVLDRQKPDTAVSGNLNIEYRPFDLMDIDRKLLTDLAEDSDVSVLCVTAGIGRLAPFETFASREIEKTLTVNLAAAIEVLRIFYRRIQSREDFYTGVISSISAVLDSPLYSVYASSKAGLSRFIESLNTELRAEGYQNRITNIAPGSIKGTRFNGGKNDLDNLAYYSTRILKVLFSRIEFYIPEYRIYKQVLERYKKTPKTFGLESYKYKQDSGRVNLKPNLIIGYMSGTWDLFHIGHLNIIKRAKSQCDWLIVGVHPSAKHKNKETFINFEERKEIVRACRYVDEVINSMPEDADVWAIHHYNKLFVGSDYKDTPRFKRYEEYFSDKDVKIVYFPYTKTTSSTQLRKLINKKIEDD